MINPISNSENSNFCVPKAGILGAAVGYLGTYAVPLTTEEHAKYFTPSVQQGILDKAQNARRSEINLIKQELSSEGAHTLVRDVFQKSADALEADPKAVMKEVQKNKDLDKGVKDTLNGFFKRVYNTGKITKMTEEATTTLAAKKDSRAALYFAGMGALLLMSLAVVKTSFDAFFPKKEEAKKDEKPTTADILINMAEVPGELYVFGNSYNK